MKGTFLISFTLKGNKNGIELGGDMREKQMLFLFFCDERCTRVRKKLPMQRMKRLTQRGTMGGSPSPEESPPSQMAEAGRCWF